MVNYISIAFLLSSNLKQTANKLNKNETKQNKKARDDDET